jgi:GTP-binding protein HflX
VILPWERPHGIPDGRGAARAAEARLAEAIGLTASIGVAIVHTGIHPLRARRPSTLLGEGQVEAARAAMAEQGVQVAVVDAALSPVQQRNLERAWGCKVIDRTGLILEIFGCRSSWRISNTSARDSSGPGPILSGSGAASASLAAPVSRRSRSIAA